MVAAFGRMMASMISQETRIAVPATKGARLYEMLNFGAFGMEPTAGSDHLRRLTLVIFDQGPVQAITTAIRMRNGRTAMNIWRPSTRSAAPTGWTCGDSAAAASPGGISAPAGAVAGVSGTPP